MCGFDAWKVQAPWIFQSAMFGANVKIIVGHVSLTLANSDQPVSRPCGLPPSQLNVSGASPRCPVRRVSRRTMVRLGGSSVPYGHHGYPRPDMRHGGMSRPWVSPLPQNEVNSLHGVPAALPKVGLPSPQWSEPVTGLLLLAGCTTHAVTHVPEDTPRWRSPRMLQHVWRALILSI